MHLSDGLIDLYRNPIDLVLRYGLSEDSGLVGRKLCDNGRVLVASPNYLARHGQPQRFEELRLQASARGFRHVESGPYVRSSYHAGKYV